MPTPYGGASPPHDHRAEAEAARRLRPQAVAMLQAPRPEDDRQGARRSGGKKRRGSASPPSSPTAAGGAARTVRFRTLLRVRPMLQWEQELCRADGVDSSRTAVEYAPEGEVWLVDPGCLTRPPQVRFRARKRYPADAFDRLLWSFSRSPESAHFGEEGGELPYDGQREVYDAVALPPGEPPLIDQLFSGINQCVLAYGATCSGKTHSVVGDLEDPGLLGRFAADLMRRAPLEEFEETAGGSSTDRLKVRVEAECVRVWKEALEDVLATRGHDPAPVVRPRTDTGYRVDGQTKVELSSREELERFLRRVVKQRPQSDRPEPDRHNRSALVARLTVVQERSFEADADSGSGGSDSDAEGRQGLTLTRQSTLTLVDLGGSGGKAPGESPQDARLASMANQAISRVFAALAQRESQEDGARGRTTWAEPVAVPYRESVLTQLLLEELGGNCRTTVLCCVSPCHRAYSDATIAVDFARRAKQSSGRVAPNVSRRLAELESRARERRAVVSHITAWSANVEAVRSDLRSMNASLGVLRSEGQALEEHKRERHQEVVREQTVASLWAAALELSRAHRRRALPALEGRIGELRREVSALMAERTAIQCQLDADQECAAERAAALAAARREAAAVLHPSVAEPIGAGATRGPRHADPAGSSDAAERAWTRDGFDATAERLRAQLAACSRAEGARRASCVEANAAAAARAAAVAGCEAAEEAGRSAAEAVGQLARDAAEAVERCRAELAAALAALQAAAGASELGGHGELLRAEHAAAVACCEPRRSLPGQEPPLCTPEPGEMSPGSGSQESPRGSCSPDPAQRAGPSAAALAAAAASPLPPSSSSSPSPQSWQPPVAAALAEAARGDAAEAERLLLLRLRCELFVQEADGRNALLAVEESMRQLRFSTPAVWRTGLASASALAELWNRCRAAADGVGQAERHTAAAERAAADAQLRQLRDEVATLQGTCDVRREVLAQAREDAKRREEQERQDRLQREEREAQEEQARRLEELAAKRKKTACCTVS
eukprot:TRINITY_DN24078_c0_g1_i4.p1 TRINITY_DN24078_c0_g1~~TRINITY_DN24078_c0_g1_i4.p1  ORF type:complete len:1018 (+),score=333.32 TRINITY_DN24078_c0_g1_i4:124-3177(+)